MLGLQVFEFGFRDERFGMTFVSRYRDILGVLTDRRFGRCKPAVRVSAGVPYNGIINPISRIELTSRRVETPLGPGRKRGECYDKLERIDEFLRSGADADRHRREAPGLAARRRGRCDARNARLSRRPRLRAA